ncbi:MULTISPECIES: HD domain-containing phosphohydrolase [Nitrospirillum]|uniref:Putative two-component system response regulator n=1 Tax=Nitrospirillum amazonense TaxID=28077 RepID=A0A560G3C6_9PROT|nr:HD domain-containing phosphohydrolase [Nitrospirillum amazonense]MEC4592003.1 HD domain-containing phosphohydrolase [Nitrospirillum amazonense]TWB28397.1 putative two-component system response regulator [Nitrospirillum amazonense]
MPFDATDQVKNARILVVDDLAANVELMEGVLAAAGYTDITGTCDPREGLALYGSMTPDLILLDFRMPGMDGPAFIRAAHALSPGQRPPILVVTAQGDEQTRRTALEAGARDFISKPFALWEMLARVQNLLELQMLLRDKEAQASCLEAAVAQRTRDLEHTHLEVVRRLCAVGEFRDDETGRHVNRIGALSGRIARLAGWLEPDAELLASAAPLHDIGKVSIPDAILLKPGKLSDPEWQVMKTHADAGASILRGSKIPVLDLAAEIAVTHHEKWDGSGYPQGLAGETIPMSGRIVAVADVFDALLSRRPYKEPWTVNQVADHLRAQSGRHFDPALVDLVLANLEELLALRVEVGV